MKDITRILRRQDKMEKEKNNDDDEDNDKNEVNGDLNNDHGLKHAIRKFYISLICQTVRSRPFRSAILSFCAMKSRKKS
jgi:hypothetical protein